MKEIFMSSEGYNKLVEELEYLKTEGLTQAAEKIAVARGFGDLSENAEYDEAMNDQGRLVARITELEEMVKCARILDESELNSESVHVGSKVVIQDANGKQFTYTISGATEADPFAGRISDESPVGKALMGKKVGETAEITIPQGKIYLEIINISI